VTANKSIIGKLMGYDVESRLDRVPMDTNHLFTMNVACQRNALLEVGLFDKKLPVGQDVDLSHRLKAASYRLIFRKDVKCRHYWRDNLKGYLRQQYDYAYYRMELARRFRKPHDQLTSLGMIFQVPLTMLVLLFATLGSQAFPWVSLALLWMPVIHLPVTVILLSKRKDTCILLLPLLFTIRNLCWVSAAISWGIKYVAQFCVSRLKPAHSKGEHLVEDYLATTNQE